MAVSSSRDYSVTGTNIINSAYEYIGMKDANESMSPELTAIGLSTLEKMIKMWQAKGVGLWTLDEVALFMSDGGYTYDIYTSGTHCTNTWVKTELSAASAASDTTLNVDSDDGMTDGDYIGVELDDGTLEWTTINGTPASDVVTITTGLTSAASVDNHVYTYTTKLTKPLEITEARLHRADGSDIPLEIISRNDYMAFSNKTEKGTPTVIYPESQRDRMTVKVWQACNDVQEYIKMTAKMPIMDMDSTSNNPEFPAEWIEPLETNLAIRLAAKNNKTPNPALVAVALESFKTVSDFDKEYASTYFRMG